MQSSSTSSSSCDTESSAQNVNRFCEVQIVDLASAHENVQKADSKESQSCTETPVSVSSSSYPTLRFTTLEFDEKRIKTASSKPSLLPSDASSSPFTIRSPISLVHSTTSFFPLTSPDSPLYMLPRSTATSSSSSSASMSSMTFPCTMQRNVEDKRRKRDVPIDKLPPSDPSETTELSFSIANCKCLICEGKIPRAPVNCTWYSFILRFFYSAFNFVTLHS
jgi:hypothetical protein